MLYKQIPRQLLKKLDEIKSGLWSVDTIETLVTEMKKRNGDISPEVYPTCALQVKKIVNMYGLHGQRVLIAGSISPWVESVLIASGINFREIHTTDYNEIKIEDNRISFVPIHKVKRGYYDMVISYSSIEHDGLGRYGDPINPNGDIAAVKEYHSYLKKNGYFMLGIPISKKKNGYIVGNGHRIYSEERIDILKQSGFEELERLWPLTTTTGDWQNQPIMVWRKV